MELNKKLNYQEFIDRASDRNFITFVSYYLFDTENITDLTKEEIVSLLNHPKWKYVFINAFVSNIQLFINIFSSESLSMIQTLKNQELLKEFIMFTINSDIYDDNVIKFIEDNNLIQAWLLERDCFLNLMMYNYKFSKKLCNGISRQILCSNLKKFLSCIADYFPFLMNSFINDIKYDNKLCSIFKEEYENYFFSFKKGQGAGLIAFLNATEFIEKQKELIKQEDYIIDILFSSKIVMVDNNPYNNSLKLLLKELLDIENATISDIKYIDSGCFSDVYRIKDLILKVGELRKNIEIPSHNLILKPFFRRYLSDIGITVEVSRYVDKVTDENIVREIFMKLYDDNIVWLDPKIENIGKIVSLKNTDMKALPQYISNESIGFIGDNMQSLKVGSYVILDTDYLIYKDKLKEENITPQVKYYLNDCAIKRKK